MKGVGVKQKKGSFLAALKFLRLSGFIVCQGKLSGTFDSLLRWLSCLLKKPVFWGLFLQHMVLLSSVVSAYNNIPIPVKKL